MVAPVDSVSYIDGSSHDQVGIELHIGRNRIVRRIFESLGYQVVIWIGWYLETYKKRCEKRFMETS